MAKSKVTRSRIPRKRPKFPEVRGKIVQDVEVNITDYGCAIGIMFQDRTYLCFEVETGGVTVLPDMSSWKMGNYKPLKHWKAIQA